MLYSLLPATERSIYSNSLFIIYQITLHHRRKAQNISRTRPFCRHFILFRFIVPYCFYVRVRNLNIHVYLKLSPKGCEPTGNSEQKDLLWIHQSSSNYQVYALVVFANRVPSPDNPTAGYSYISNWTQTAQCQSNQIIESWNICTMHISVIGSFWPQFVRWK